MAHTRKLGVDEQWLAEHCKFVLDPPARRRDGVRHALRWVTQPHESEDRWALAGEPKTRKHHGSVITFCEKTISTGDMGVGDWAALYARVQPRGAGGDRPRVGCANCLRAMELLSGSAPGALVDGYLHARQDVVAAAKLLEHVTSTHLSIVGLLDTIGAMPGEDDRARAYRDLSTLAHIALAAAGLTRTGARRRRSRRSVCGVDRGDGIVCARLAPHPGIDHIDEGGMCEWPERPAVVERTRASAFTFAPDTVDVMHDPGDRRG